MDTEGQSMTSDTADTGKAEGTAASSEDNLQPTPETTGVTSDDGGQTTHAVWTRA